MDIDEFTDTPNPYLSVKIKVNQDSGARGYESYLGYDRNRIKNWNSGLNPTSGSGS